jgi:hypothetical protein
MNWLDDQGKAAPPADRHALGPRSGISLLVVGAILVFAVSGSSPHWLNWRIVGIVLILAAAFGMVLPRRTSSSRYPDMMSRWVLPGQFRRPGDPAVSQNGEDQRGSLLAREISEQDPPTLADDLVGLEHDPPV